MNARCGVARVLVDGILHLAKESVELDEILLGPGVGHGQVVLLSQRVLSWGSGSVNDGRGSVVRHVLLSGGHRSVGDGKRSMERQQGAANLSVRGWVDLTTLGIAEEVIDHVIGALTIVATSRAVAKMLCPGVQRRLVEVETVVGGWLRRIVTTRVTRVREGRGGSSHLTTVVVVACRAWKRAGLAHRKKIRRSHMGCCSPLGT
jgi:hypothetical protein